MKLSYDHLEKEKGLCVIQSQGHFNQKFPEYLSSLLTKNLRMTANFLFLQKELFKSTHSCKTSSFFYRYIVNKEQKSKSRSN